MKNRLSKLQDDTKCIRPKAGIELLERSGRSVLELQHLFYRCEIAFYQFI